MTIDQLHDILDNKDKKLSLPEIEQVIYELRNDSAASNHEAVMAGDRDKVRFYQGEQNAFQIVLDLLQHLQEPDSAELDKLKDYIKQCENGEAYWVKCLLERPKETAKEILDEVSKHFGGSWLADLYKKYDIKGDE